MYEAGALRGGGPGHPGGAAYELPAEPHPGSMPDVLHGRCHGGRKPQAGEHKGTQRAASDKGGHGTGLRAGPVPPGQNWRGTAVVGDSGGNQPKALSAGTGSGKVSDSGEEV